MADSNRRNRATLRNYFRGGSLPTEVEFRALIDSTLNMVDEGFTRSPENGVEVSALGQERALLSFCAQSDQSRPDWNRVQWTIAYGTDAGEHGKPLAFVVPRADKEQGSVLALDPRGRVGVAKSRPDYELDVNGVIRSAGRIGGYEPRATAGSEAGSEYQKSPVPADGKWHNITGDLTGCSAFEIMAGAGDSPGKGRYALLHAFALNAFNPRPRLTDLLWPRRRIRTDEAYFSRSCDRLELRWVGTHGRGARYHLEIRSRCAYGKDVGIQYFLTELWFDSHMSRSRPPE